MNTVILSETYLEPPVCQKEILRYAGCKEVDDEISALLESCIKEVKDKLTYKVCYCEANVSVGGDICDFGAFKLKSEKLALYLKGCNKVIIFAATIGVEIDRLIAKYGRISPLKALLFQAIGAERIEALCDAFCEDISHSTQFNLKPRFSPGYGDLPLDAQKDIFAVLTPEKRIGLTLNDSLLMSPSKSVTAFIGLSDDGEIRKQNKCSGCSKPDCEFRSVL